MSTLTAPTTALDARSRLVAAYARAFDRAIAAKLVAYHNRADDTYAVPSTSQPGEYHTVRHLGGSDWANLSCTCKAASHPACLHRAITAFFRARHISASLPRCGACSDLFCNGGCPLTTPVVDTASTTEPCRHDWQGRDGGSEYVCAKCGAGWSYDTDPVQERHEALGRNHRAVTLDGASPAYRASLEADAAAIVAAAVRDYGPDPLADLF